MIDTISPYDFGLTFGFLSADVIGWTSGLQQNCPVVEEKTFLNEGRGVLVREMQIELLHLWNMQTCFQEPVFSICLLSPFTWKNPYPDVKGISFM